MSQTLYLFLQVALCNQATVVLRHWMRYVTSWQGPSNHAPLLWELLVLVMWFTLNCGELSKTCRRISKNFSFDFFKKEKIIFPALIDNPNNFENNRMIRLLVSGMFLLHTLLYLWVFLHFSLIFWNTSLRWTPF